MSVQDNHGFGSPGSASRPLQQTLRTDEMTLIQSVSDHGLMAQGVSAAITALTFIHANTVSPGLAHVMTWLFSRVRHQMTQVVDLYRLG